jgi:hypothetical protein
VVYRQWLLGPNGNIIRWPLAATYRFLTASGKRDYLWTQAGMALLLVATPVLFPSSSIPPGSYEFARLLCELLRPQGHLRRR